MDFNLDSIQQQPVSDDPELVKALAGLADAGADDAGVDLQFEGLTQMPAEAVAAEVVPVAPVEETVAPVVEAPEVVVETPVVAPVGAAPSVAPQIEGLENIKINALHDLRPLMGKLDVSNEEKFSIYLLLLRSSDDKTLIEPAYEAARSIEDETTRANALLDVIKEIDYFNSKSA